MFRALICPSFFAICRPSVNIKRGSYRPRNNIIRGQYFLNSLYFKERWLLCCNIFVSVLHYKEGKTLFGRARRRRCRVEVSIHELSVMYVILETSGQGKDS